MKGIIYAQLNSRSIVNRNTDYVFYVEALAMRVCDEFLNLCMSDIFYIFESLVSIIVIMSIM